MRLSTPSPAWHILEKGAPEEGMARFGMLSFEHAIASLEISVPVMTCRRPTHD